MFLFRCYSIFHFWGIKQWNC